MIRTIRSYIVDIVETDDVICCDKDGHLTYNIEEDKNELVRCKDCKHRYISGNVTTKYYVCDFMDAQYEDDGYCSHGERGGKIDV